MTRSTELETTSPDTFGREFTLSTAVSRLDFLSRRDNVVIDKPLFSDDDDDDWGQIVEASTQLDVDEALEMLALGVLVARKAHENRALGVRAALRGGATWHHIGIALGVSPRTAWERHLTWLDQQDAARLEGDPEALDAETISLSRELAGRRPS